MKKYLILLTVFIFSCQSNLNQNTNVVNNNDQNKTTNGTGVDSVINKLIDKASNDQVDYNGEDKEFRSDFNVSSSDKKQSNPTVAINNKGDFVVSWVRLSKTKDFVEIYARKFFSDGTKTEEFKVNNEPLKVSDIDRMSSSNFTYKSKPKVSIDDNGNFSISWKNNKKLYLRSFDSSSKPTFSEIKIDDLEFDTTEFDMDLNNGNTYIIYNSFSSNFRGYTFKKFDISGKLIKEVYINNELSKISEINVNSYGEVNVFTNNSLYKINSDGNESLISKFDIKDEYFNLAINHKSDYLIVVTDTKDIFVANKKENKTKANSNELESYFQPKSSIVLNDLNDYVIAWGSASTEHHENYGIFAKIYNGTSKSELNIKINSDNSVGFIANPSLAISNTNLFATTWENWNDNKGEYSIFVRKIDINNPKTKNNVIKNTESYECIAPSDYDSDLLKIPDNISDFDTDEGKKKFQALKDNLQKIKNKPVYNGPIEVKVSAESVNADLSTSYVKANDTAPIIFQTGTLILNFNKSFCKDKIFEKYKPIKLATAGGYDLVKFDLSNVKISDFEKLLREQNKYNLADITKLEFSSEDALKTMILLLDLKFNYRYAFSTVELNILSDKK
jgi:hypothetical protein